MKNIYELVRDNLKHLTPYSTARDDCKSRMSIYLDANENPYDNGVNRYPSPHQEELKKKISVLKNVPVGNIFLGNGSDEPIDLILRLFCPPGKSSMLQIVPTYKIYSVSAVINDVDVIDCPLDEGFALSADRLLEKVRTDTRVIFLCSPNNPTGNLLDRNEVMKVVEGFDGIVVVDEAYIDFAGDGSLAGEVGGHPNLVILQTFSKAWGMAGLRLGLVIADSFITGMLSRIKYPYNISILNQAKASELLDGAVQVMDKVEIIKNERQKLYEKLQTLPDVVNVYPSDANFLLVKFRNKQAAFDSLVEAGIIVRDRSSEYGCENCLRVTVGTPEENAALLKVLGTSAEEEKEDGTSLRMAEVRRRTKETDIVVRICLDRFKEPYIRTGLHFFNHMLEQIGYHSMTALDVVCYGDIQTDDHHTVEDVAIALGEAIGKALGNKAGIERYGFSLPMDEAEASVLLDIGGRTDFIWDVRFSSDRIGDVSSQMFEHFFKSLAENLHCNLHVRACGKNDHHIIEGVFKAFARALKQAVYRNPAAGGIPSSKGQI